VQDKHGSCDRPTKQDFTVAANAFVGQDTMSTLLDPLGDVQTAARPKEARAEAEKGFINAKVAADWAAVKHVKEEAAECRGHDNEEQRITGLKALSDDDAAVVETESVIACELLKGWM
jgi:hypothetical protein